LKSLPEINKKGGGLPGRNFPGESCLLFWGGLKLDGDFAGNQIWGDFDFKYQKIWGRDEI